MRAGPSQAVLEMAASGAHARKNTMPGGVRSCEMKAKSFNEIWIWPRWSVSHPTVGERWVGSQLWWQQWISETSRWWDRRVESFRNHTAIDGSLEGVSGRDAACGWAVVQLDYDKEEEPWYATYGAIIGGVESPEFGRFQACLSRPPLIWTDCGEEKKVV